MKPQAIRRSPSEIALAHQRRAHRLSTTPARRHREFLGGLVLAFYAVAVIAAAHYGPN